MSRSPRSYRVRTARAAGHQSHSHRALPCVTSSSCDLGVRGPGARAPPGLTATLLANVDDRLFALAEAAAVHLEDRGRLDQVTQLGIAIAAGVEIRALLGEDLAYGGKPRPAVIFGRRLDRVAE